MANYLFVPKQRKNKVFVLNSIGPVISPEYQKIIDKYKASQERLVLRGKR